VNAGNVGNGKRLGDHGTGASGPSGRQASATPPGTCLVRRERKKMDPWGVCVQYPDLCSHALEGAYLRCPLTWTVASVCCDALRFGDTSVGAPGGESFSKRVTSVSRVQDTIK